MRDFFSDREGELLHKGERGPSYGDRRRQSFYGHPTTPESVLQTRSKCFIIWKLYLVDVLDH